MLHFLIRARKAKSVRIFPVIFSQASLAFVLLSYPLFLHIGANNGSQNSVAKEQFDFCGLFQGQPAQSCSVTSRFVIRKVQSKAGDPRACAQASTVRKFFFHPWRRSNWDKTSLRLYASYYWQSDLRAKWLKARFAQYMLGKHHEMDAKCNP